MCSLKWYWLILPIFCYSFGLSYSNNAIQSRAGLSFPRGVYLGLEIEPEWLPIGFVTDVSYGFFGSQIECSLLHEFSNQDEHSYGILVGYSYFSNSFLNLNLDSWLSVKGRYLKKIAKRSYISLEAGVGLSRENNEKKAIYPIPMLESTLHYDLF